MARILLIGSAEYSKAFTEWNARLTFDGNDVCESVVLPNEKQLKLPE